MKQKIIIGIIAVLTAVACQDLDQDILTTTTYEQVTQSYSYTRERCSSIYTSMQNGFEFLGGAMMASVTDESEHTLETDRKSVV